MKSGLSAARFKSVGKLILAAGALAALGACAVVPAGPPIHGHGGVYVGAPVVVPVHRHHAPDHHWHGRPSYHHGHRHGPGPGRGPGHGHGHRH